MISDLLKIDKYFYIFIFVKAIGWIFCKGWFPSLEGSSLLIAKHDLPFLVYITIRSK